jgi:hypothetical protein
MDDPINIHGTYVPIVHRIDDYTLRCHYAHKMSKGLIWAEEGDSIGFINRYRMNTVGYGVISQFKMVDENSFILAFEDKLPNEISIEYSLENISWTPNATITNCFVGSNRARGYLISTPGKVVIENNIFETSGSAILIAGDANYWYESGAVKDVVIRNNEFRAPCNSSSYQFCNAIISIYPEIPELDASKQYHKNIIIEGNSFNPPDFPILFALSVDGLKFTNNSIKRSYEYTPWHPQIFNFYFDGCKNIEISGNTIGDDVLGKNVFLKNMRAKDYIIKNDELEIIFD